jgi:glutamate carboxypeptidase
MQQLSATERDLVGRFNADAMLSQVQAWSAVNTGTRNLDGLARQWDLLAEAFSDLPGEIRKVEPARVPPSRRTGARKKWATARISCSRSARRPRGAIC